MNKGIIMAVMSSLTFSIMNVLVKLVSTRIPSSEITFFRGLIGTILVLIFMKVQKVKFSNKENKILYLRGLLGGIYMLTYFYAISKLKLGDVSILVQLSGVFVVIFSSSINISGEYFLIYSSIFSCGTSTPISIT